MSNLPRQLTRNTLGEFLPNLRAVRAFEQMLKQVGELLPADVATLNRLIEETTLEASSGSARAQMAIDLLIDAIQDAAVNVGVADGKANEALETLGRIARALELLATAPATKDNNSLTTDYIDFALNPRLSTTPGRVHWGPTGTLEIEMGGGNITQQVGEEFFVYGKATAAISEGQLIMVTGAVGASGVVTFAPTTTGLLDPNAILGIATENIALNGFGRVTTMGVVHGINTSGASVGEVWADGDVLWYNTGFVGSMTNVKPVAPNMKTQVAIVIHAGAGGSGSLQVEVLNGSTLGGTDTNVQLGALVDKQLLQYDAVAGYWKNVAITGIGSTAAETHAAASKATPVDADELPLADSASSFTLKKLTWANLKATLATWIGGNLIAGSFTSLVSSTTGKVATTIAVGNATPSASGSGVTFPAAQSASTDANTLDDYEEGTWTPTLNATTGTITALTSATKGAYTKVGRKVTLTGYIYISSVSLPTGTFSVGGLPFATASGIEFRSAGSVYAADWKTTATTSITCFMVDASGTLYFRKFSAGVESEVAADLQANASLAFSITYMTN